MDSLPLALLGSQTSRTRVRRTPASRLVCLTSLPARSPRAARLLPFLVALLVGTACSKQGEGERCDINNGDLDCDTGLICVGEEQISITGTGVALCCPITDPTVDACRANTTLPPEPDAGITPPPPPLVTTPDAGNTPPPAAPDASMGDGGT